MTKQSDIIDDPKYIPLLDHGFLGIVAVMGDDAAIVQAARVSYGSGTKSVREDRALIRYLMSHQHSSPFEMADIKFHVRAPIFVIRQWARHRNSSTNEESARYSEMSEDFYLPDMEHIQPQAIDNKQGRAGEMSDKNKEGVRWFVEAAAEHSHQMYKVLLDGRNIKVNDGEEPIYDPFDSKFVPPLFDDDFIGTAREIARIVMPLSSYSEFYWKANLWNVMNFLRLRCDPHAQYEIRVFAEAMLELIKPLFPAACEAFTDYIRQAKKLSRMETRLVYDAFESGWNNLKFKFSSEKEMADHYGMTVRELTDFKSTFVLVNPS